MSHGRRHGQKQADVHSLISAVATLIGVVAVCLVALVDLFRKGAKRA